MSFLEKIEQEKKAPPKTPKSSGVTYVRNPSSIPDTLKIAAIFAYKYARTKKRWFAPPVDEDGFTLDPKVRTEADCRTFRDLVYDLRKLYHYDLLS